MTLNLATIVRVSAARAPDDVALAWGVGAGQQLTYGRLDLAARHFAGALAGLGVTRGQHVALLLPNVPQFTVAYFGAHYAGCPIVPLNVLLNADEILYHLDDSDAVALVAWEGFSEQAIAAVARAKTCKQLVIVRAKPDDTSAPEGTKSFAAICAAATPVTQLATTMPDDTAVILYTSGTTGRAKGAELTHFNLFYNAEYKATKLIALDRTSVSLGVLPMFHSFGQTVVQNGTLMVGGRVVLMPRFEPTPVLEAMQAHRATFFAGVPTMYFALLHHPEASRFDLSSLRYCCSGGAPMPVEVMKAFDEKYRVNILEGYGLSETSPVASFNVLDQPKKPGSIGLPLRGVEFKLVDENDRTIDEPDKPGEICIQGPNLMKGYYKRPEATAEAFKGGWFHTGDVAVRDADGYYFIVDRKKDMIIRGGYNVYPREIEEILYSHPAIGEAAVIGVPHESHGEEVKAVVALKPGASATSDEIIAFCKAKVAAYKYPRIVEIRASLPKGPTGKILKRELRSS